MTKGFVAFLGLLAFTGLVGCARTVPNRVGIDPAANVAAPALAGSAFLVAPVSAPSPLSASVTPNDKARITILKTALEKEFLLQSTLTTYGAAPSFGGLRSRVVAFRERAGKVYLLEATQGHTVTNDLPITLLLAEFPILAEDDTQVTIDFNAGMSNIFVAGDWYAHDFEGPAHERSSKSAKVRFSYIESAALNDHNQLAIRQIAQLGGDESSQNNESVEVKYYLSPYLPAADFEPVRVTTPDVVGFFEVAPQLTSEGTTIIRAAHFHAKSQITYAVSANTPAEFKQAVKDGILYWNKVFGDERVKVVDAPAGVTAPDVNYNIVQWVPFDSAGFAFADAQMDPRSGETLHAQVYLTSAFAYLGKDRMRVALKRQPPQPATPQARYSLAGFERAHLCDYDSAEAFELAATTISAIAAQPDGEAKALKAAQDYVRQVTAHEVGHTLGLRHNFAGSLAENFPLSQRKAVIDAYVATGSAPAGTITSSSVMDYNPFEEDIIFGDQIARQAVALEYDVKAIDILYKGKTYKASDVPAFCTDPQVGRYVDCARFDTGASPVEYALWEVDSALDSLPYRVAEQFVRAVKSPYAGNDATTPEKVVLAPDVTAAQALAGRSELFSMLSANAAFLKIRRNVPYITASNIDDVRRTEQAFVADELERLGGYEKAFAAIPADYADVAFDKLVALLNSGQYAGGTGPDGRKFEFSAAELSQIKSLARSFFDKLKVALVKADLSTLSGGNPTLLKPAASAPKGVKLADFERTYKLVPIFEKRLSDYVFAIEEGKDVVADVEIPAPPAAAAKFTGPASLTPTAPLDAQAAALLAATQAQAQAALATPVPTRRVTITLPKFAQPLEVRIMAAGLLRADRSDAADWAFVERARAKKRFQDLALKSLGGNAPALFKLEEMPRAVSRWLYEGKLVSDTLGSGGGLGGAVVF